MVSEAARRRAVERNRQRPQKPTPEWIAGELAHCEADAVYFINTYCKIYDNDTSDWIPFTLWPFQEDALRVACEWDSEKQCWKYLRIITLKTRQIGFTWLFGDAHKLWKMRFRPITEVLVFSQSDEEAIAVLSDQRLKGMYERLPDWMKIPIAVSSAHEFRLSNGSGMRALPESRGGDSRTVTDVVIDEADLITDLNDLIARAKPTLGSKGQMIVIGRAVKDKPNSAFKKLYAQAEKAEGEWNKAIFIPWYMRPDRTNFAALIEDDPTPTSLSLGKVLQGKPELIVPTSNASRDMRLLNKTRFGYRIVRSVDIRTNTVVTAPSNDDWQHGDEVISMSLKDSVDAEALELTGTLDSVHEHLPATVAEAIQARTLDKKFPPEWITRLSRRGKLLQIPPEITAHPGLRIYKLPEPGRAYGIGSDPAGGNSNGDDSVSLVVDARTLEEVAVLAGKIEPTEFANQTADVSKFYFNAPILTELNNHGNAMLAQLKHRGAALRMVTQNDSARTTKPYWLTTERSKSYLYDIGVKVMQQMFKEAQDNGIEPSPIIFSPQASTQLASIDINTLSAPEGDHDDYAMAWVLAQMCVYRGVPSMQQIPHTGLWPNSRTGSAPPSSPTPGLDKLAQLQRMSQAPVPPRVDSGKKPETVEEEPLWVKLSRAKGR